jgi:hypothetical protein
MQVMALLVVSVALVVVGVYILFGLRRYTMDKEKRRRLTVNHYGRLSDATIMDVYGDMVFYEYSVSGVVYAASQDISDLRELISTDPDRLIGPVGLKYSTRNPANSIILCEEWSGLRAAPHAPLLERKPA